MLSNKVYENGRTFTNKKNFWNHVVFAWSNLDKEKIREMCEYFDDRLYLVLEKNGEIIN